MGKAKVLFVYIKTRIALVEVASSAAWRDGFIKRPPGIQVADNTGLYQKDLTGST